MKKAFSIIFLALGILVFVGVPARQTAPTLTGTAEVLGVYFTPPSGAASAIVQAIDRSEREVLVQAYGFTHNGIAQALLRAQQRGVTVRVLLDKKVQAPIVT